jgi:DNA-binding CsgD family transcriptional regulator
LYKKLYLPFLFIQLLINTAYGQRHAVLSGYVKPDTTWLKKVYISRITDFNLMYTASDKLIIAEGEVDSTGHFTIQVPSAREETLYRIHMVKKRDPVSTLIIGSEDENHVFFIAGDSAKIYFRSTGNGGTFSQAYISGGMANKELNALLYAIRNNSNRDSLKNQLVNAVEHDSSELVGLFATYSMFALNAEQKARISTALKRYHANNPYGSRIFEEYKTNSYRFLISLVAFIATLTFGWFLYGSYKKNRVAKISQALSQRESNFVRLILDGRTNKEIASELNIELSTVKTHVNNIYAKLKVGNRKELLRYKEIFGGKR